MNKQMKKGFTLIELLFVMAIISILIGFGVAKYKNSRTVAFKTSMQSDMKNAMSKQNEYYSTNKRYGTLGSTNGNALAFGDTNGMATGSGTPPMKIPLSELNGMHMSLKNCANGEEGYVIVVKNSKVKLNSTNYLGYIYDDCTDGTPQECDGNTNATSNACTYI